VRARVHMSLPTALNTVGIGWAGVGTQIRRAASAGELNHIVDWETRHLLSEAVDHQHGCPREIAGATQLERQASCIDLRRLEIEVGAPLPIFEQITSKGDMKIEACHGGLAPAATPYCVLRFAAFASAATRARRLVGSVPCATGW